MATKKTAPAKEPVADKKERGAALAATRQAKMDETFSNKKFEIIKEVHLEGGKRFETPFGNKGRHGYVLREVGNEGNVVTVGATMLQRIADVYGAVTVPTRERKRRTKEQKEADDARLAEEKAARKEAKAQAKAAKEAEKTAK